MEVIRTYGNIIKKYAPDHPLAAFRMIKAGLAQGFRIPEDIKVFGFDNTMYASLSTPTISTISQPRRDLGIQSAKLLLSLIKNPYEQAKPILLPSKLVIQEST